MKHNDVNITRTSRPRVLVCGYLWVNLGDDLLFRILVERYPAVDFYVFTGHDYERIVDRPNLHVIRRNRLNRIFASHVPYQYRYYRFDAVVYIGGSIFIEKGSSGECSTTRNLRKLHKAFPHLPIHIVGCNYGPEQTPQFRREVEGVFEFVESVTMRDTYSYNLFSANPRVSCAPDVVFNLCDRGSVVVEDAPEPAVALSVIDLASRPELEKYTERYDEMIVRIAHRHLRQGRKVRLLSFCSAEGDVVACERILNSIDSGLRLNVEIISYGGDIDHFLAYIRSASVLYATRFHATILGTIFGVPTLPIIYSDKTEHVLDDMGWLGDSLDLRNPCTDCEELQPHQIDSASLEKLQMEALNQFASLDKVFGLCHK